MLFWLITIALFIGPYAVSRFTVSRLLEHISYSGLQRLLYLCVGLAFFFFAVIVISGFPNPNQSVLWRTWAFITATTFYLGFLSAVVDRVTTQAKNGSSTS